MDGREPSISDGSLMQYVYRLHTVLAAAQVVLGCVAITDVSNDLMLVELASLVLLVTVSAMGSVILVKGSLNRII